jgi:polysaccharide pyruvyl transferase WcaK-like protein
VKKSVLIINQGKTQNLGDKAINIILGDILQDNNCEVQSAGFAQCTEQHMEFMEERIKRDTRSRLSKIVPPIFVWLIKYYWNIKREFTSVMSNKKYDAVIIGGGQLIKTKCVFPYALLSWYLLIKKHLKCPIILLAVGVDDKFSKIEKLIYIKILPKLHAIYVRDDKSKQSLLEELGIKSKYIPDLVFSYSKYYALEECAQRNLNLIMIYNYEDVKFHFGMHYSIEEYYESWEELILSNSKANFEIILGYTTIEDKRETMKFAEYLKRNHKIKFSIADTDTLAEFLVLLPKTETIVAGRMHALLLGMNYGCKPVPYIISSKISAFKNEWIDKKFDINLARKEIDDTIKELLNETRRNTYE